MADDPQASWDAYLRYIKRRANRQALQEAQLYEHGSQAGDRKGSIDGRGQVKIEYLTFSDAPPRASADLEQYESLSGGGVWQTLREDDASHARRDADGG